MKHMASPEQVTVRGAGLLNSFYNQVLASTEEVWKSPGNYHKAVPMEPVWELTSEVGHGYPRTGRRRLSN